jgi:molybdenum cofactor cytidylyltransferase
MNLGGIIPAAGYSSRIGGFKPLMQLGGQSLLECCAGLLQQAGIRKIIVVTGHRGGEVEAEAQQFGLQCIHNPDYAQGMFSSVCTAVRQLSDVDGFFMLPVDIPLIRPATIATICTAFNGRSVTFPCFDGMRGHPPLIPAYLIPAILKHDGQGGLRTLLEKQECKDVAVWDKGILMDADTPEDVAALTRHLSRLDIGEPAETLALATLTIPERGLAHGLAVANVARALGRELNQHGLNMDVDILHNAALLHDIAKGQPQHETRGADMLKALGLGRLAEIVAVHRDVPPPASGRLTEKEVVCLADKLIHGSKRVSVRQRFEDKLSLYAQDHEACRAIRERLANALALQALVEQVAGCGIEAILGSETDA